MPGELHQVDYDRKSPEANQWERLNYALRRIFALLDQKQATTESENGGGGGSGGDHSQLTNLAYASSGHTGFAPTTHAHAESDVTGLVADLAGKVTANTAITGATKTKITYDSKGLVTGGVDATTADIADSINKRYVTDAEKVVIGNTSNTNTGDETAQRIGNLINGANVKLVPVDNDMFGLMDSETGNILTKLPWSTLKAIFIPSGGAAGTIVDIYDEAGSGTWIKNGFAKSITAILISGGAGGGPGVVGGNLSHRQGGSGGGGGSKKILHFDASELGDSESYVVGAGGVGGSGASATNGTAGGYTEFAGYRTYGGGGGRVGNNSTTNLSGGGGGGTAGAGPTGASGTSQRGGRPANDTPNEFQSGGCGGSSMNTDRGGCAEYGGGGGGGGTTILPEAGGSSLHGGGGGGHGGNYANTDTYYDGGAGGQSNSYTAGGGGTAGTSAATPTPGGDGSDGVDGKCGDGGGGGGAGNTGGGAKGGNGGYPGGGGGGGGGCTTPGTPGDGGDGADGKLIVIQYLG